MKWNQIYLSSRTKMVNNTAIVAYDAYTAETAQMVHNNNIK